MHIRPFTPDDVPEVAALFRRIFRPNGRANADALADYFRTVYFDHPWTAADDPSLVSEADGRVRGFFGVLPFPMRLGNRRLTAAIGGNFMVDPDHADPFGGAKLLKAFLGRPRDLSMTDTSNDLGRRSWESQGGSTLHLYSLQWLKVLRPAGMAVAAAGRKRSVRPFVAAGRLVASSADSVAARLPKSPFRRPVAECETEPLTVETLLAGIEGLRTMPLRPDYDADSLGWLIERAGEKREFGPLVGRAVKRKGAVVGWFLYYPNRGKWAQVVQMAARPGQAGAVLDALLADAWDRGSVAVVGRTQPQQMPDLTAAGCVFVNRNTYTQFRTGDEDVRNALLTGGALLTRLEGEWWTRFQNDAFDEPASAPVPQGTRNLLAAGV